jgi:hypothetical protein
LAHGSSRDSAENEEPKRSEEMNQKIRAAFDQRIAEMKAEEDKLAEALKVLEQIDFSVSSGMTRLYDAIPWSAMERASGYTRKTEGN